MADWFLTGADLAFLTDAVVQWVAYGIGFGAVLWLIGLGIYVVWELMRF